MSAFFKIDLFTKFAALCLTGPIDWRYIHSLVGIFDPACKLLPPWTKELYLCTVTLERSYGGHYGLQMERYFLLKKNKRHVDFLHNLTVYGFSWIKSCNVMCTVAPLSSLWPPPPPIPKLNVQYIQIVYVWWGGGGVNCAVDHILQVFYPL